MKPVLKINNSHPFQVWKHVGDPREEVAWHCATLESAKGMAESMRRLKGANGHAWDGRVTIRDMRKHCGPSKADLEKIRQKVESEKLEAITNFVILLAAEMVIYSGSTEDAAQRMLKSADVTIAEIGKHLKGRPEEAKRLKDLLR